MRTSFCIALLSLSCALPAAHAGRLMERRAVELQDDDTSGAATRLPAGVTLRRDVPYGDDRLQRMDVYIPAQAKNAPVIVMVHGGGWRRGDKAMRSVVENKLARWTANGFIFISVNYRMLPQAEPAQQADDVAKALASAQAQAASWGADPSAFLLMGHSAGAHLVALLSADPSRAFRQGAKPWLGTVALDSAALDVVRIMQGRHMRLYDQAFGGDPSYWKSVSPFHALSSTAVPLLAVCSSRRTDSCPQARQFVSAEERLGVRASVLEQDLSHRQINEELGLPGAYTSEVEQFMHSLGLPVVANATSLPARAPVRRRFLRKE
ncbi:alpha/beta hydrolase [Noviherbaspirillum sp.]|jgi:acetyl esterase/lipase|uniref:alpha/beta hydrolase n=1 Tax=Noviherbaspirillum sp. TaxID=1926288 RepID=UPI0025E94F6D|nr:alpha/beta hydrolase [Noviherbaspirillum sp.]